MSRKERVWNQHRRRAEYWTYVETPYGYHDFDVGGELRSWLIDVGAESWDGLTLKFFGATIQNSELCTIYEF